MSRSLPTIHCPECKTAMMSSKPKLVLFTRGLEEVTYSCLSCGATTVACRFFRTFDQATASVCGTCG